MWRTGFCLSMALACVLAVVLAQPAGAVIVDRYSFNDGTANNSVGTRNGTLMNGAAIVDGALVLNGSGAYLDLGGNDIAGMNAVTIEAWGTYDPATGNWSRIFDFGDTNAGGEGRNYIMQTPKNGANGLTRASISNADPGYNGESAADAAAGATGNPLYTVFVFDNATLQLTCYVNGIAGTPVTAPAGRNLAAVSGTLGYLGKALYNNDPYLMGSITEFRVWNNVLSAADIAAHYAAGPDQVFGSIVTWDGSGNFTATGTPPWSNGSGPSTFDSVAVAGGTLNITTATSYTGGTAINAGTVIVGPSPATIGGNAAGSNVTVSGGLLSLADPLANLGDQQKLAVVAGGMITSPTGIDQTYLSALAARLDPSSTGALVLADGSSIADALDFTGLASLRLGTLGAATVSGSLTPSGTTYRLGGGGGTLTVNSDLGNAPDTAARSLAISGPGTVVLAGINTYTGNTTVNSGTLKITGSTSTGAGQVVVNGGTLEVSDGGVLSSTPTMVIANGAGTTGRMVLSGNASVSTGGEFWVGQISTNDNTLEINDNASLTAGNWFVVGRSSGRGTLTMNGGTVTKNGGGNIIIGSISGRGTWIHNGGAVYNNAGTVLGETSNTGTLNLNGGTFQTQWIDTWGGASGYLNFNGGTLQATVDQAAFVGGGNISVMVQEGGAVIDSNGRNITVGRVLQHGGVASVDGGLTKKGNGTLTLTAANTFTGPCAVDEGTLALGAGGSLASSPRVHVALGATFDVSAAPGLVMPATQALSGSGSINGSLSVAGTILPGTDGTIGTLTFNNGLILDAATLKFDLGDPNAFFDACDLIHVGGALNVSNTATLAFSWQEGFAAGTYRLMSYAGKSGVGAFSGPDQINGLYATYLPGATSLDLVLSLTPGSEWKLAGGANWDDAGSWIGGVPNGSGSVANFAAALQAPGGTVALNSAITAGKIKLDNATASYTLGAADGNTLTMDNGAATALVEVAAGNHGIAAPMVLNSETTITVEDAAATLVLGGPISGWSGLTKDGPGTVQISAAGTYGGTTVSAGTLQLAGGGTLPDASVTVNGGVLDLGDTSQTVGDVAINGGTTQNGTLTATSVTVSGGTVSATVAGNAALTKTGAGTATLSGANTYAGGTVINAGTLVVSDDANLGDPSGMVTFNGGTLQTAGQGITSARMVLIAGAATFDSNGQDSTLSGDIYGPGPLTKIGDGSLAITGNAALGGGQVVVNGGTLAVSGSGVLSSTPTMILGNGTGTTGRMVLGGDASVSTDGEFWVGQVSTNDNTLEINDNASITSNSWFVAGRSNGKGTVTMNGGTVTKNGGGNVIIGSLSGNGTWHHNAGTVFNNAGLVLGENSPGVGNLHLNGGTFQAAWVQSWNAGATGNLYFNGGTLQAVAESTNFLSVTGTAVLNTVVQEGGAVIDSNGHSLTIARPLVEDAASPGGGLTKAGEGTLLLTANNTYTGPTKILAGTLKLASVPYGLAHRWSFNGDLNDSVGGAVATIQGGTTNLATLGSTQITLAGGAKDVSQCVALPAGVLPKTGPLTIELWATQNQVQNWARIFDFGSDNNNYLMMSWTQGTNLSSDRASFKQGGGSESTIDNRNAPYALGTEYHIAMVVTPGGGANGMTRVEVFTAPSANETLGVSKGYVDTSYTLANLSDVNVWLGQSQWPDNTASANYNECRLWNLALPLAELDPLHQAGPDAVPSRILPATPVHIAAGAILDLNGSSLKAASLSDVDEAGGLLTSSAAGDMTVTLAPAAGTATFSGTIDDGAGTLGLTVNGAEGAAQILSGLNTYSGGTTVNGGTLEIAAPEALPAGGSLTIGARGTVVLSSGISVAAGGGVHAAAPVPEPGSLMLLAVAAAGLLCAAWGRRSRRA